MNPAVSLQASSRNLCQINWGEFKQSSQKQVDLRQDLNFIPASVLSRKPTGKTQVDPQGSPRRGRAAHELCED